MSILVVDDEIMFAMDLADALRRGGYDVGGIAPTPDAALRIARRRRPRLALMDINLAGGPEGIAIARRLKQDYGTKIIFITAHTEHDILNGAALVNPIAILTKPIDQGALFDAIERAFAGPALTH